MAAVKLHLKNNNKDYKLKATDKRTTEGRIIYKNTKTGELHSELSMTLEMPEGSGNWINVPSLINGRVYNVQGVIDMLNAGKVEPNSTGHATQEAAVEAAIYRSNNLQDDDGISLRPNNELTLSKDSIMHPDNANKTQGYSQAELDQINQDYRTEQSEAQTKRLTKIMNNQDLEKNDQFYQMKGNVNNDQFYNIGEDNPWGSSVFGNYKNLPIQYSQPYGEERMEANMARGEAERAAIAQAKIDSKYSRDEASLEPQIPTEPKPGSRAGSSANLSMEKNPDKHHVSRDRNKLKELAAIMDRANAEKEDDYYDANKPRTNIWGDNATRYWEGWFKGPGGKKAIQNKDYGMTISAADQAKFDEARSTRFPGNEDASFDANTVYDMGVSDDGIFPGLPRSTSKFDQYRNEEGTLPSGPPRRSSRGDKTKPIVPEVVNIPKNVKPDYGEMPGFKLPPKDDKGKSTGNYWSVDEKSPFWQTDAGYEKAMEVWGEKPGWVKPGYRPKKKELDIGAIKKWFTPSK